MGNPNAERRLAAASAVCDAARAEYEKAVAGSAARPKPVAGWREAQARAVKAAVALGVAQAELNAAKRDAGLLAAPARPAGGKVLVALVRVPDRAAAALLHGPGDLGVWIAEAVALQYASDFDPDAGEPGNPWAVEVRARFGADAADADAFTAEAVGFLPADGEEARALAAIVEGRAECFPDADKTKGGGVAE